MFASPDEWFDVFCTHTQADANAENENVSHRRCQFQKLRDYMNTKRAIERNGTNGFDRSAVLLGDLNQVGPRSLPNNACKYPEMTSWLNTVDDTYPPVQNNDVASLKAEYKFMRETLGNWHENLFDGLNMHRFMMFLAGRTVAVIFVVTREVKECEHEHLGMLM